MWIEEDYLRIRVVRPVTIKLAQASVSIALKKAEDVLTPSLSKLSDDALVRLAIIIGTRFWFWLYNRQFGKFLTAKPLSDRLSNRQPISRQAVGSTQPTRQRVDRKSDLGSHWCSRRHTGMQGQVCWCLGRTIPQMRSYKL